MTKILAVSGGVDSVVLLHFFRHEQNVVVAHFNHGIRPSAGHDQEFVRRLVAEYHLPFETATANLGPHTSEAAARTARYDFLFELAQKYSHQGAPAMIYTAHHLDDLAETLAINFLRGTGWRGLAPFGYNGIARPFLSSELTNAPLSRADILRYAATHQLSFCHDPTNTEDNYLRNRLRPLIAQQIQNPTWREQIFQLFKHQQQLKQEISTLTVELLPPDQIYQRSWFEQMEAPVALEFLRAALLRCGLSLTTPQLQDFLQAIRTYQPGKNFNLPGNRLVALHKTFFSLKDIS